MQSLNIYSGNDQTRKARNKGPIYQKINQVINCLTIDIKISLALFHKKAKISNLFSHTWLFEIQQNWTEDFQDKLTQKDYHERYKDFYGEGSGEASTAHLLVDDKKFHIKSFVLRILDGEAILDQIEDYRNLRIVLNRSISLLYHEQKINNVEYESKQIDIIEWCNQNYDNFLLGKEILERQNAFLSKEKFIEKLQHISVKLEFLTDKFVVSSMREFSENKLMISIDEKDEEVNNYSLLKSFYDYQNLVDNENPFDFQKNFENLKNDVAAKEEEQILVQKDMDHYKKEIEMKDKEIDNQQNNCERLNGNVAQKNRELDEKKQKLKKLSNDYEGYQVQNRNFISDLSKDLSMSNANVNKKILQIENSKTDIQSIATDLEKAMNDQKILMQNQFSFITKKLQNQKDNSTEIPGLNQSNNNANHKQIQNQTESDLNSQANNSIKKSNLEDPKQEEPLKIKNWFIEQTLTVDSLAQISNYRKLKQSLISLVKASYQNSSYENQNLEEIETIGQKLAKALSYEPKPTIKFVKRKKFRYYKFPIFGMDNTEVTGFLINNKLEGYGIISSNVNNMILYGGDFILGKIHGKDLEIFNEYGKLLYKGSMLKSKRHEYGETWFEKYEKVKFKGQFQRDEYDGQNNQEFFETGQIYYQGGHKNGLRHGYGVEYWKNGSKKYEGQWQEGLMHDSQKFEIFTSDGHPLYLGQMSHDKKTGSGTIYFADPVTTASHEIWKYTGGLKDSKMEGHGELQSCNGNLIYKGEQLNNNRNGFGVSYWYDGTISYKGIWKNNQRTNFGIEYDQNFCLVYKGQWLTDKRHGSGTSYYTNGNKQYEGDWLNGSRHGMGTLYDQLFGHKSYKGKWFEGTQNGYGEVFNENGDCVHVGVFEDGAALQNQTKMYSYGKYTGEVSDGVRIGNGVFWYEERGERYEGSWFNDQRNGNGKLFNGDNELIYDGNWSNDCQNGKGKSYYNHYGGIKLIVEYDGMWKNGKFEGIGTFFHNDDDNKEFVKGMWHKNMVNGHGSEYRKCGSKQYEGSWVLGAKTGYGVIFRVDGSKKYEGLQKNGKYSGAGVRYNVYNSQILQGVWNNDNLVEYKFNQWQIDMNFHYIKTDKCIYVGQINQDQQKHGKGNQFDQFENLIYSGDWEWDLPEGFGIKYWENGYKLYEGQWEDGNWNGAGSKFDCNGILVIKGKWCDGKQNEFDNEHEYTSKRLFVWKFLDNFELYFGTLAIDSELKEIREGNGILYDESYNKTYEGFWKNDLKNGFGAEYWNNGKKQYEGQFVNGEKSGKGISYYYTGKKQYTGEWLQNKRNGGGCLYYSNGTVLYEGNWENDECKGKGVTYSKMGSIKSIGTD